MQQGTTKSSISKTAMAKAEVEMSVIRMPGGRFAASAEHVQVDQGTLADWEAESVSLVLDPHPKDPPLQETQEDIRVLMIDDNPGDRRLIEAILEGVDVIGVETIEEAANVIARDADRVVLLDLRMPGHAGVSTVLRMRTMAPYNPIVVLTGLVDEETGVRSIAAGAQDFLRKEAIGRDTLLRSIRYAKQRAERERDLERRVLDDPLTGLPNRRLIRDRLEHALAALDRDPEVGVAVLFIDLDGFKDVNDEFGHEAGDEVLMAVSDRLRRSIRTIDSLGRYGGDEFVVICGSVRTGPELVAIAHRISGAMEAPIKHDDVEFNISVSIGGVLARAGSTVDGTIGEADRAMYHAKRSKRA